VPPSAAIGNRAFVALPPVLFEGKPRVDQYIQQENITLFRKRLSETSGTAERKVILRLLAAEQAKGDPFDSRWTSGWLESELQPPK
jgi:hypothetical protein